MTGRRFAITVLSLAMAAGLPTSGHADPSNVWVSTLPGRPGTLGTSTVSLFADGTAYVARVISSVPTHCDLQHSRNGGLTWRELPAPLPGQCAGVQMASPTVGFAYGDDPLTLKRTADGGATWTRIPFPGEDARTRPVQPKFGLAAAGRVIALASVPDRRDANGCAIRPKGIDIFVSTDSGRSWARRLLPALENPSYVRVFDARTFALVTGSDSAVGGGWHCGPGWSMTGRSVWVTHDGGRTWRRAFPDCIHHSNYCGYGVAWLTRTRLLVAHASGTVYRSDDGGRSFRPVLTAPQTWSQKLPMDGRLAFANADCGYAVINGGGVWRTDDGGGTWEQETLPDAVWNWEKGEAAAAPDCEHAISAWNKGVIMRVPAQTTR